jgi:hypothetical protein
MEYPKIIDAGIATKKLLNICSISNMTPAFSKFLKMAK